MARKIIGAILAVVGSLGAGILIASGMLFPHLAGPVVLIVVGVLLLVMKRKGERHE